MSFVSRSCRCILLTVFLIGICAQLANANIIKLRGGVPPSGGSTPLSAPLTVTSDAASFLVDCDITTIGNPYPAQWDWDPVRIIGNMPQSATEAMGLTPKIEQYRGGSLSGDGNSVVGGTLVATYSKFSGTFCPIPDRPENPGRADSLACGGPFQQSQYAAWKAGDIFLVYPAVYKDSLYVGPVFYLFPTVTVTTGDTHLTIASTANVVAGDAIDRNSFISPDTHIQSVDSPTQVTITKPVISTGTVTLSFWRSMQNVIIHGVTQNVALVPTRPALRFDETFDLTEGSNKGMVAGGFGATDGDVKNFTMSNIDVLVNKPPYGKRTYIGPNSPFGLIDLSGTETQGNVKFENMRIQGGMYINYPAGADGVLSGNIGPNRRNSGTLTFNQIEFSENGGSDGPSHNIYIGDGYFTLIFTNNWSHLASFGHLLKSRAMNNIIIGNYFEGGHGMPQYSSYGESNLIDLPCGGAFTIRNNILTKRHNGQALNPDMIEWFEDRSCNVDFGGPFQWTDELDQHFEMTDNTFVAFGRRSDSGGQLGNAVIPLEFYGRKPISPEVYPRPANPRPDDAVHFPTTDVVWKNNVYAGMCPTHNSFEYPWTAGSPSILGPNLYVALSDLNEDFSLKINYVPAGDTVIVGQGEYQHAAQPGATRALATFGAQDWSGSATPSPAAKPEIFFWEDKNEWQLGLGQSAHLSWGVTGANSCTASGAWSGTKASPYGTETVTPPSVVGPVTYILSCTGPSGTSSESVTLEVFDNPVLSSFTADHTTTASPGNPVTFTWASTNTDYCQFTDAITNAVHSNDSLTATPNQTITYSLHCLGAGGKTARQHILVTVGSTLELPTVYFWSPNAFLVTSADLHWESNGATSCTGTGFSTGGATSGVVTVTPTPPSTTYQIQCAGPGGTSAQPYIQVFTP